MWVRMCLWGNQSCGLYPLQKAEEDRGFQTVSFPILKNPKSDAFFPLFTLASAQSELDLILLLPRIF